MKGDLGLHELWTGRHMVARAEDEGRAAVHRPWGCTGRSVVVRVRDGLRSFVVTAWRMVAPSGSRRVPLRRSGFGGGSVGGPEGGVRWTYPGLEMWI